MPENIVNYIKSGLITTCYFCRFFLRHFYNLRGMQTASSLAYTTLLSIVPLVTVMFGLFGKISVLQEFSGAIQDFVFNNFVPEFGVAIQGYIGEFSTKASQLTISGIMVLVVIAIMLMATIDNAFNRIWFVKNKRSPVARLLMYWAVLTMGPVLIGVGLASTSYLLSLPVVIDVDTSLDLKSRLLSWLPFLTTSTAFTLLYVLVPNCFVSKKHALLGGLICAVLFELAKYGFGIYVKEMPSYENIYGAIAIVPLFLIWIYVSWMIVLFGAHITFCLSSFRLQDEIENRSKGGWNFVDVLHVLEYLYQAQKEGRALSISQLRQGLVLLPHYQINDLLELLQRQKWVNESKGSWLLSKDLKETCLYDLHKILPVRLPVTESELKNDQLSNNLKSQLSDYHKQVEGHLSVPIAEFFKGVDVSNLSDIQTQI
ncbi:MAG: membrane protein [Gammaproteobacteria bacterium]|jgi:membrane protein